MAKRALLPDLFATAAVTAPAQVPPPVTPATAPIGAAEPEPTTPDSPAATNAELGDAAFMAVSDAMRGWTIGEPGSQAGGSYANARHVRRILRALRADGVIGGAPDRPDARPLLRQVVDGVLLGHVQLRPDMGELGRKEFEAWLAAAGEATERNRG